VTGQAQLLAAWSPEAWSALGNVLLGVGVVTAGVWTLFNYYRTRRAEAARWLQGLFREFYLDGRFTAIRNTLEYHYDQVAGPLLERRITDRDVPLSSQEELLLGEFDTLLNYFEHLLYLEREKHLQRKDRQAVFEYWFDIMSSDNSAAIRKYAARLGFEDVAATLGANDTDYIAVYGSLMRSVNGDTMPKVDGLVEYVGPCRIGGALYDLGDYPGLVPDDEHEAVGELYRVLAPKAFRVLDEFERYDAHDLEGSLYHRRCTRLREPRVDAWVYVYNRDVSDRELVESGDWRAHLASRQPGS